MSIKTWAFTPLALLATGAFAQNSVQVYGIVDAGVTRVTGLRAGSVDGISSGIMDGSRVGFRGNEDLGGGYRAIFTLEHRLEADTGAISNRPASGSQLPDRFSSAAALGLPSSLAPVVSAVSASVGSQFGVNVAGNFWDRQLFVGLITPVGAVLAGRQYTPAYEIASTFDTLGTQSGLAAGQVASFPTAVDIRLSNTVAYRIQQGPISGALMAGAGEGSATTGRFLGGNAMYKTDAFSVGLGYNTRENEAGRKSLTTTVFGVSAALGPGTAFAQFAHAEDDNPSGLSSIAGLVAAASPAAAPFGAAVQAAYVNAFKQDADIWHVGYRLVMGVNTVYLAYSRNNDKLASNADTASYGVAYSYALSKRTDINAVAVRFNNNANGQLAPGNAGYLGGVTASAGTDSTGLSLGIRHRF